MRFKTDENLPEELADAFRDAGWDALSVGEQRLSGRDDAHIAAVCSGEDRILVTLAGRDARDCPLGRSAAGAAVWRFLSAILSVMNFSARYEAGDHHAVWGELIAAGDSVRGELQSEALEVVRLTMTRVRRNVERLVAELTSHGFQFGLYPDGEVVPAYPGPLLPPQPEDDATVRELETLTGGTVPLSIYGFWKWVGSVCLVGYAQGWPQYADPLWVEGPEASLIEFPDWEADDEPFGIVIAPDVLHKDNISGGSPYDLAVPNAGIDGVLRNHASEYYFIDYLREALAWGGFPGRRRPALRCRIG
jgi:hypothetical protein